MVLTFSKYLPWFRPDGKKVETDFVRKIQDGRKKHTFRSGERWHEGRKIDFFLGNPRNGGTRFNPSGAACAKWISMATNGEVLQSLSWGNVPDVSKFRPAVHGTEPFKFEFLELGEAGTRVRLFIDGVQWFEAYLVPDANVGFVTKTSGNNLEALMDVASADGLSSSTFLRWFVHLSRKDSLKEITGQIIHWTPLRYVADVGATITES